MKLIIDNRFKITVFLLTILIMSFVMMSTVKAGFSFSADPAVLNSDTQINLNWSSVTNAVYYSLIRDDVLIANIDVDLEKNYLGFEDTGLSPETSYLYNVAAVSSEGNVIESASRTVSTAKMKTPSITSSHLDINSKKVTLVWVNNSLAVDNITVTRGDGEQIAVVSGDETGISFVDPDLFPGTDTEYTLLSSDGEGHLSDESSPVTITPISLPFINASIQNRTVTISWDTHPNIDEFRLERAKYMENSWGSWEIIKSKLAKGSTKITDYVNHGTYRYRLSIDNEKYTGFSNISEPVTRLLVPSNLQCTPVSPGRIDLNWTNPPGSDFSLEIERKDETSSDYVTIAILDSNITSYTDTNNIELNKSYYYKVTAHDQNGSASTSAYHVYTGPPSRAKSLYLEISSPTMITLNWQDTSGNESGFKVERRVDTGAFVEIASLPANTITYTDNVNNTWVCTYRVIPFNPAGNASSYSNTVSSSTSINRQPPRSLQVTPVSHTQIDLSWEYADLSNYKTLIERRTGENGKWSVVKVLEAGITNYSDIDLLPSTQFFYRVRTVLANNVYSIPYPDNPEGMGTYTKIESPAGLKAARLSSGTIKLTWTDMISDETGFIIERKSGSGSFIKVATQNPDSNEWYDSDILPNMSYTYRIKAINPYNSSNYSNEFYVGEFSLNSPENLGVTVTSNNSINLSWENKNTNVSGFRVETKSRLGEAWKETATLPSGIKNLIIKNLEENTLYRFRVAAIVKTSSETLTAYSNEIEFVMKPLSPPSNLIVKSLSPMEILLEWKGDSENAEGYIIERGINKMDFVEIAQVGRNINNYTDNTVSPDILYYYRVKLFSGGINTNYSNTGVVRTSSAQVFSDLDSVPWAKTAIKSLSARGIIQGRSQTPGKPAIFAPNDRITRAEFITLVVKAFGIDRTPVGTFTDVKPNHWFYKSVITAKNMGIVTGTGDNCFYPNEPIKREDMAVILAKAHKITGNPLPYYDDSILNKFKDKGDISSYALSSMAIINGEGIINGKSINLLAPKDFSTRAEAAVMLYNSLKKQ